MICRFCRVRGTGHSFHGYLPNSRERGEMRLWPADISETYSRLGLAWANGVWLEGGPQVKGAWPTFRGRAAPVWRALRQLGAACLDDFEGEVLELGEQGAEFLGVVE